MTAQAIAAIYGMEPGREGEYPTAHVVGSQSVGINGDRFTVSRIDQRAENYGDHGLLWFDVFDTLGNRFASMQARAVAEVIYAPAVTA